MVHWAAMGLQVLGTFSVGQSSFVVGGMHVEPGSELDGLQMLDLSTRTRVIAITGQTSRSSCTHAAMPCCEAATPYTSSVLTANCWTRCARDSLPELFGAGAALACRNLATVPAVTGWGGGLVVGGWGLWLEGLVPPPVGAFAGGPWAGWDGGRGRLGGRASDPARSRRPVLSVTMSLSADPVMVITPRWCSRWWYGQTSTRLANSVAPPSSQWTMWWACSPRVARSREPRTWGGGARGRGAAAGRRPGWRARAEGCPWR
ncbi:hypothetical protein I553_4172 [Mycobacterium xenopi 4042]|uniref:Uncharacterized protein n=1 Tax=Mycobacterium xenopi 4042 TaxID=1299334 RepID=X8AFX6_MYCXE|nr:hypothetical protein I553_4172 [Mycobacterium xenopi 4042]